MKKQKYKVALNDKQREMLKKFVKSTSKKHTPQSKVHAKVLLSLDENGERLTPKETAHRCKIHKENVYKVRKQYVTEGFERVLYRKKREEPPIPPKVTGEVEAKIIAIACSAAPKGRKHWTLQLIAEKIVLDGVVDSIGKETVRRRLKKHNINLT